MEIFLLLLLEHHIKCSSNDVFFQQLTSIIGKLHYPHYNPGINNQQFSVGESPTSGASGLTNAFLVYAYYADADIYDTGDSGATPTSLSITSVTGDVMNFAYDGSTGKLWAGVNGIWFLGGNSLYWIKCS
jgi:hypothetical protein